MTLEIHPDIEPIGFLVGTWRGNGAGEYPTIESFSYVEEVTFGHVGKPFLSYGQKTRSSATGVALHAETGYWRLIDGSNVEVVMSHPTGILELLVGTYHDGTFDLRSGAVTLSPTAKPVTATYRRLEVAGDVLRYELSMAAVGLPLTHHLSAELHRVSS